MTVFRWLIGALWLVLFAYWIISAVGVKRDEPRRAWRKDLWLLRVAVIVLVLVALRTPIFTHGLRYPQAAVDGVAVGIIGVVLCTIGIGLAISARAHLGRNWGMPMSRKVDAELVTTGPYAFIRHPIYTGLMLAMLGSALAEAAFWFAALIVFGIYFLYSARREERFMLERFPDRYPAYVKRTKMFLPFVV